MQDIGRPQPPLVGKDGYNEQLIVAVLDIVVGVDIGVAEGTM